jgi:PKHD-type hydroxylase
MNNWPLVNVSKDNTSWIAVDNIFADQELDEIVKQSSQVQTISGTLGGGAISNYRVCEIAWLESNEIESDFDWVYATLSDAIRKVNNEHFRFDLTHLTPLQFTVYNASNNGNYQKHLDLGRQFPNRKLSFSVQLSDDTEYTGGDLRFHYIKSNPEVAPREKGKIIFFPSWVVHEVTPITQGTRRSLVGWVNGPNFK